VAGTQRRDRGDVLFPVGRELWERPPPRSLPSIIAKVGGSSWRRRHTGCLARPPEFKAFRPGGQPSPTAFPVCKISPRRMTLITLMRVSGLANPAFLLEVEAVAAMPE
jgi:hypothetical protein